MQNHPRHGREQDERIKSKVSPRYVTFQPDNGQEDLEAKHPISALQPPVELHIHIDGAARYETLHELMTKKNIKLPGDGSLGALKKALMLTHEADLDEFLRIFDIFYSALVGDLDAIERVAYELCEDQAKNGVVYFEGRFAPHLLATTHGSSSDQSHDSVIPEMVLESVIAGFQRGEKDFNVKARIILCCMRGPPFLGWVNEVVDLCDKYRNKGVVGIDIAGNEGNGILESFNEVTGQSVLDDVYIKAFKKAYDLGIHRTVHACEVGPPDVAKISLDQLHAERLGHGYRIVECPSTYQKIRELNVHLECCPCSSICTGTNRKFPDEHPMKTFADDKINFSISSDDPILTGDHLMKDMEFARSLGLTDEELIASMFNAAKASFLPEDEKQELIKSLNDYYHS